MRISAKLNIFLGAPNAVSALMPHRLAYMTSYFRTDRLHPFFGISVLATTVLFAALCYGAYVADDAPARVAALLLSAFAGLALIEHLFLALPVRDEALWSWALPRKAKSPPGAMAGPRHNQGLEGA